jgi:hypothetical protein
MGLGNGAGDVHAAELEVGLIFAHDLAGHFCARVFVFQLDGGPKHHLAVGLQGAGVDDVRGRLLAFHLFDAPVDEGFSVFSVSPRAQ